MTNSMMTPPGHPGMTQTTPTVVKNPITSGMMPINTSNNMTPAQQQTTPQRVNATTPLGSQLASPSPIFVSNKTGQKLP